MQVKNKLIALLLLVYSSSQAAYYCPTCVNTDGGGSQQGYSQFQSKYELMTHELQKQQYDAERTLRYKCLNMDYEINILNSKITNVEMLLIKFKAAQ